MTFIHDLVEYYFSFHRNPFIKEIHNSGTESHDLNFEVRINFFQP
jgi:hypothetical protein